MAPRGARGATLPSAMIARIRALKPGIAAMPGITVTDPLTVGHVWGRPFS